MTDKQSLDQAQGRLSTRPALSSTAPTATPELIVELLTPILVLVCPIGMSEGDRQAWYHAAYFALKDQKADRLRRAARYAIRKADRPGAIVAMMFESIESEIIQ